MAFKFIALFAFLAVANASYYGSYASYPASSYAYAASGEPLAYTAPSIIKPIVEPYNPNPQYSFNYGVSDATTGDHKSQQESRNGDQVTGSYSFIESDGTKRTVNYVADDVNGFNAVVQKEPATVAVQAPAPVIVKSIASPVYQPVSIYRGAPAARVYATSYAPQYVQTVQNW